MKRAVVAGLMVVLGAGAAVAGGPALTGFHELAARGELIEVRKPVFMNGTLRVGGAVGKVRRRALGEENRRGFDGIDDVSVRRFGTVRFDVTGAEVGGTLSGECRYARAEARTESGGWSVGAPTEPLRMTCEFQRDGRAIGWLRMGAVRQAPALFQPEVRGGEVEIGGTRLALRSAHRMGKGGLRVAGPVGYLLDASDGTPVAAVDTNGFTRARLALPHDPAQRDAALAAGVALAVFWDPGDTDD